MELIIIFILTLLHNITLLYNIKKIIRSLLINECLSNWIYQKLYSKSQNYYIIIRDFYSACMCYIIRAYQQIFKSSKTTGIFNKFFDRCKLL